MGYSNKDVKRMVDAHNGPKCAYASVGCTCHLKWNPKVHKKIDNRRARRVNKEIERSFDSAF